MKDQKLVVSVVQSDDAENLVAALLRQGYGSIILSSTGGFLRRGNSTILTATHSGAIDDVIDTIRETASSRTELRDPGINLQVTEWYVPRSIQVQTGGASIWVMDAEIAGFLLRTGRERSGPGED